MAHAYKVHKMCLHRTATTKIISQVSLAFCLQHKLYTFHSY